MNVIESDHTEAEKLGITVFQYQTMKALEAKATKLFGPKTEDPELIKAQQTLEKKQREVEALESERLGAVREWDSLLDEEKLLMAQRQCGEYMAGQAELERADCEATILTILNKKHGIPALNEYPNGILEVGRRLAGAKEVLALVPAWRADIEARQSANAKAQEDFKKKHGIEGEIPREAPRAQRSVRKEPLEVRVVNS